MAVRLDAVLLQARHRLIVNLETTPFNPDDARATLASVFKDNGHALLEDASTIVLTGKGAPAITTASILKSRKRELIENDIPIMETAESTVSIPDGIKKIAAAFSVPNGVSHVIIGGPGSMKTRLAVLTAMEMKKTDTTKILIFDTDDSINIRWLMDVTGHSRAWLDGNIMLIKSVYDTADEIKQMIEVNGDDEFNFIFIVDNGRSLIK